jgi:hypothetical protein
MIYNREGSREDRDLTITFETSVYKRSRAFRIRKAERAKLGIGDGDSVHLIVKTPSGRVLFRGRKTLRSGADIYRRDIAPILIPGAPIKVEASEPITVYRTPSEQAESDGMLVEGSRVSIRVNRFERNRKARQDCIKTFGTTCRVCGFDFEYCYGKLGKGFIHVHHLTPVSRIGEEYKVDPKKDLLPVCPNCHDMLHSGPKPPLSVEELRAIIMAQRAILDPSRHA